MQKAFRETKIRGSIQFPYKIYTSLIPEHFSSFPMHWHDDFEIIWVKSGHLWINIQSKLYLCGPEDILIIPPKYIHSIKQYKKESAHYCNMIFKFSLLEQDTDSWIYKKYFSQFINEPLFESVYFPGGSENQKKLKPFTNILYEARHSFDSSEMKIKAALYNFLDEVKNLLVPETENFKTTKREISRLKPVFSFVEENFSENLTVDHMAETACLSRSHFMTVFKKVTGQTFVNYVNTIRLENAKRMILETDKSILEISEDCGFNNFSYFIRTFKKQYGKTPLSIRKNQ